MQVLFSLNLIIEFPLNLIIKFHRSNLIKVIYPRTFSECAYCHPMSTQKSLVGDICTQKIQQDGHKI